MYQFVIDITDLANDPGATKQIEAFEPIRGLRGALGYVDEAEPVKIELNATSIFEGIEVAGKVGGRMHLSCSRCLVEFEVDFEQKVAEVFYHEGHVTRREEEDYEVNGSTIDLEPMLRDVIVLGIPIRPLHDEGCKGLCTQCGADLNTNDCGHQQGKVDIRWAPLSGFFDKNKE
ncbi:MAG: DUF177 domain-containing protein [Actinomycetota bacterium]|nr:DUF177 domain-containing protein [Actinomycetota bacterium]